MSKINLAQIGLNTFGSFGTEINFLCDDYLLDYDFLIVNGSAVIEDLQYLQHEMEYEKAIKLFNKRSNDLKEFYHHGGTLVLLIDDSHVCPDMEATPEFKDGKLIDIMSTSPAQIDYVPQHGSNVQYHPVASRLAETVKLYFKAILNHTGPNTLLRTQRTQQPLSYHCNVGNGFFLAMPDIDFLNHDDPDAPAQLFEQLVNICQQLKQPETQLA